MRVLLDTHTLLWFPGGDERLSARAREIIEDGANEALASVVSLWEIAIKHSLERLKLDGQANQGESSAYEIRSIIAHLSSGFFLFSGCSTAALA